MRPRRRIPQNVSVPTGVSMSTVKIEIACGKPLGDTHITPSLIAKVICPIVLSLMASLAVKSLKRHIVQTQVVAQASGLPEADIGGTHLNSSGKPNGDNHLSGRPMIVDLTSDANPNKASNNKKRQRTNETNTYLTNVEHYL